MASSRLKSGLALRLGLGRKLYFAVFLGLNPTTVGGDLGGIGGLSIGGWRRIYVYILHVCSKIRKVRRRQRCVVLSFRLIVRYLLRRRVRYFLCFCLCTFSRVSCSSICFPKSISHETAYQSLCDILTSGSGRYSFARTVTSGIRCSGTYGSYANSVKRLGISSAKISYCIVVIGKHFDHYIQSSPDAILKRKFCRLVVGFRDKYEAIIIDLQWSCGRFAVVIFLYLR